VPPSPIALYSYDAARLVIRAIETAGLNRMRIRDELTRISFDGLTGKIQFNSLRGNISEPVLMSLKDGRWQRLN
jgi:ABC-type branched-subunit amino acid transport system substrate-binding protein